MDKSVKLKIIELIDETCNLGARKQVACEFLGIYIRSLERWKNDIGLDDRRKDNNYTPSHKLTKEETELILATVNSEEFKDMPPCKIVPRLAEKSIYIASESSFYRILREKGQLTHRSKSSVPKYNRPEPLIASRANQVWSWDITYLPSLVLGLYHFLYMIMDIWSKKIVGWSIHSTQSADFASLLIKQACIDENIKEGQIHLHSDNGTPMKGRTMLAMLEVLGVVPSFSRPSVSDDNPYSESLFKTLKYHHTFPLTDKFSTIEDARVWSSKFAHWYNFEHMHSALKFITPHQRHTGNDVEIMSTRHTTYLNHKSLFPKRWGSRNTRNWNIENNVYLNPGRNKDQHIEEIQHPKK